MESAPPVAAAKLTQATPAQEMNWRLSILAFETAAAGGDAGAACAGAAAGLGAGGTFGGVEGGTSVIDLMRAG